jgi:hypothetical protein
MNKTLLDHQAKYLLSVAFISYLFLLHRLLKRSYLATICSSSLDISQSVVLTLFSCFIFFVVFAAQQFLQLLNFVFIAEAEFALPLIKINMSNIFICLVCSSMFYVCFINHSLQLCEDSIGLNCILKFIYTQH